MGVLSVLVLLPVAGAIALGITGPDQPRRVRAVGLATALATFAVSLVVLARFDPSDGGFQLQERLDWIPAIGASYHLGVDGIALVLVLLTTFITPLVIIAHWHHRDGLRGLLASFLVMESAVLLVFLALDLLLFYVAWEAMLVPMYLIIGIWGYERRRYAAVKFFLYTLLGGLVMLVAILVLYTKSGSFAYSDVLALDLDLTIQRWLFWAFLLAFAIKIPMFPVHTWLPDAHTEAPTGGSVVLAAVLLKMGAFGLLRYSLPLFGDAAAEAAPWLLGLGVVGILYGALMALWQRDLKRLVAYSSVSHMGFVVLGIAALDTTAAAGSVVQMVNHGLSTGALFLLVGFLYDRRHTRQIAAFGGLARRTPIYAGLFLVVALSSLALPGLNGFAGEFPILAGTFRVARWAGTLGAFGAVLAALYLLWAYQRVFHGPLEGADNANTPDLRAREVGLMVPLVALIVLIGLYPRPLYDRVVPAVERVVGPPAAAAAVHEE